MLLVHGCAGCFAHGCAPVCTRVCRPQGVHGKSLTVVSRQAVFYAIMSL